MVADKIHFQNGALAPAFLSRLHHWDLSHINGKASQAQLIVDGVLKEVCEFRLAEVKTGVAKPKVGEIELGWGINVPLALDIVPDGFFDEEGILKEVEIILDGIPGQIAFLDGLEAVFQLGRIGETADVGGNQTDKFLQVIVFQNLITFFDVTYVSVREQPLEILYLLLGISHGHYLGQSAIRHVFI